MATADAIADLGDTLVELLQEKLNTMVLPNNIKLATPDELKKFSSVQPAVTIFLYQVGMHAEMRNAARRITSSGGTVKPPLPLELRYLITPWASSPRDTYRLVGAIAQLFHDRSVLTRTDLRGHSWEQDDTVEILMESLPVQQHHDIWETTESPYRLSLTYLARVIGIDSALSASGPPVISTTSTSGTP